MDAAQSHGGAATGAPSAGGGDRRAKRGREELPHVRDQGQKPGGPHARGAAAKRSYPTSEAPQDEAGLTTTFQTWPRGWFHIPKDPDFPVPS